jgi:glycosyltransferase involved in cell wall biosynthesis
MTILSIVITSLNEGRFLLRTLESVYATTRVEFEVIIVDDASSDSSTGVVDWGSYSGLLFHRNSTRLGLIRSRILGSTFARGRYLVFMDAHCNPEPGWEQALMEASRQSEDRAIVSPIIPILDADNWRNHPHQIGRAMVFNQALDMAWCDVSNLCVNHGSWQTPVFSGSCFLVSRAFYNELGGLDNGLDLWGGENIDLSLRGWMLGGKVLAVESSVVGHMYKSGFNYSFTNQELTGNKLRVAYVNFSSERFQRVAGRLGVSDRPAEEIVPHWPSAQRRRTFLLDHRCYDDDWYAEKFGIEV